MTDRHEALKPATPEAWLQRFLAGATQGDVALTTPSGHAVRWAQFRFVYPRYRPVAKEWQPPAQSLDALVMHFGPYELALPAAVLEESEFHDLTDYEAARADPARLPDRMNGSTPMAAAILLDRIAAVHSRIEVTAALLAFDREPIQDLLAIPGVRLERSRSRPAEIAGALDDAVPTPEQIEESTREVRLALLRRRSAAAARLAEADVNPTVEASRPNIRSVVAHLVLARSVLDGVPPDYDDDADAMMERAFIEAVRRRSSTRDLLRLVRIFVSGDADVRSTERGDEPYWKFAWRAYRLGQDRTAWLLGLRSLAGYWRRGSSFLEPSAKMPPDYEEFRSAQLGLLADLAHRTRHPYWSTVFTTWKADYDAGLTADHRHPLGDREHGVGALLARVRTARAALNGV
jgi:hypothetical protein